MDKRQTSSKSAASPKGVNLGGKSVQYYFELLDKVERRKGHLTEKQPTIEEKTDIEQEIARRRRLENNDLAQNIKLKRQTLDRLFLLLAVETVFIFMFALFQGIGWPGTFHLEDWSFKLLVTATIAQITGMLYVAVRYLFPKTK